MGLQIDWRKIDTVLLDMDGTLLDLHYDNYFWRQYVPIIYGKRNNLSPEQAWKELEPLFVRHMGTLNWYCVNFWSEQLDLDIMHHKQEVANKISYRPNAEKFLRTCRAQVSDLRLITNAHRDVLNLKITHTRLDQYFDRLICSHELNAPKEKSQFWHNLQQDQSFNPERSLFVDDSEAVLDAAAEFGIGTILSIAKPDSNSERTEPSKYTMINTFA